MFSVTDDGVVDHQPDGHTSASSVRQVQRKAERRQHQERRSRQMGATTEGISAARSVPRKTKFTSATSARAIPIVTHTSWMASR
jgi:hypothetical protein